MLHCCSLRREVQDDILSIQHAERAAASFIGTSSMNPDTATQTDVEGQLEKSTLSVNRAPFPCVKALHTNDGEEGVAFVVNGKAIGPKLNLNIKAI